MIKVNNNDYKLMLLDTNIISEICNNIDTRKCFLEKCFLDDNNYIAFCITPETIFELEKASKVYELFKNIFIDNFPSLLTKFQKGILEQEIERFITNKDVDPILFSIQGKEKFEKIFEIEKIKKLVANEKNKYPSIVKHGENKRDELNNSIMTIISTHDHDSLESLLGIKIPDDIFNNKDKLHEKMKKEVSDGMFEYYLKDKIKENIINYYVENSKNIPKELLESIDQFEIKQFPSIALSEFCFHQKVHNSKKELGNNDVSDLIISSVVPYVDIVITENFQANLYKQAIGKKYIPKIECLTLADLKNTNHHF